MSKFFDDPILNSPYAYPDMHWKLVDGQPTEKIVANRGRAEFITPISKSKKQKAIKQRVQDLGADDALTSDNKEYDACSAEFDKLGKVLVPKTRMNADHDMSAELRNISKGNHVVIFGEPDNTVRRSKSKAAQMDDSEVQINRVDVVQPSNGEIRIDGADDIACWFIDADYNEVFFFIRQACFVGGKDPYKYLKAEGDNWQYLSIDSREEHHVGVPAH